MQDMEKKEPVYTQSSEPPKVTLPEPAPVQQL